tara:strand:+ start:14193 stop:15968 length:1776 start_codon:yes stop_codon:yes gene_type:complete
MMTRIDKASVEIKKGFDQVEQKPDHTPVTNADVISSRILTDDWKQTAIISEEWPHLSGNSVQTWVDPLDATKEYTEGLTQYVSVMACLTVDGVSKAGIVHFPFRNETWAAIDGEWLERPAMSFRPPDTVLVSRSHPADVQNVLKGFSTKPAGGAGYKAAEVLRGNALAYVHTGPIKTWDICAIDALLRASNTSLVSWKNGRPFNYTTISQRDGIFVSTTQTRLWFGLTLLTRDPKIQFLVVVLVWLGIYLYPNEPLEKAPKKKSANKIGFVKCASGLLLSYIIWGIAQERIMTTDYDGLKFQWPAVLVFLNRLFACSFAEYLNPKRTTPLFQFSVASFTNVISSLCQYSALGYVTFPLIVVFKSLKMIPVLLIGKCFFGKQYTSAAYALAFGIAAGVALCLSSHHALEASQATSMGVILLGAYVVSDAVTSQWQSRIYKQYPTSPIEMMYNINLCSVLFTGVLIFMTGQLDSAIDFVFQRPEASVHVIALVFPAVIGQWFIFKTLEEHGAATFSLIMTSRQVFSLLASCFIFGHVLDWKAIAGAMIVFTMLFIKTRIQIEVKSGYVRIPEKDPEKGYDSMDEYELESDHED